VRRVLKAQDATQATEAHSMTKRIVLWDEAVHLEFWLSERGAKI
jgi:hypothetical protein